MIVNYYQVVERQFVHFSVIKKARAKYKAKTNEWRMETMKTKEWRKETIKTTEWRTETMRITEWRREKREDTNKGVKGKRH